MDIERFLSLIRFEQKGKLEEMNLDLCENHNFWHIDCEIFMKMTSNLRRWW